MARPSRANDTFSAVESRKQNPFIIAPDLEDADLRGCDLTGVNFSKTNLCAVHLDGCRLDGARMIHASLSGTHMADASLRKAILVGADLHGTNLTGAASLIRRAQLDNANLEGASADDSFARRLHADLRRERIRCWFAPLFPIRIDDAVVTTTTAWAASLRRVRHIGDFCDWTAQAGYRQAIARLLRDLWKADGTA